MADTRLHCLRRGTAIGFVWCIYVVLLIPGIALLLRSCIPSSLICWTSVGDNIRMHRTQLTNSLLRTYEKIGFTLITQFDLFPYNQLYTIHFESDIIKVKTHIMNFLVSTELDTKKAVFNIALLLWKSFTAAKTEHYFTFCMPQSLSLALDNVRRMGHLFQNFHNIQ